ncbi:hypothetical protein KR222_004321 [Zaprionus bogoriensis]|nr:hypothetical protein KR222_004321 [Zaprionus bogoriensis]
MRLTLSFVVLALCLALGYALAPAQVPDQRVDALLQLADQGAAHANEGDREVRGYGRKYGHGGWGRGGYGHGGWGRGGYGHGGWGRGGYGRGGYGHHGKWGR